MTKDQFENADYRIFEFAEGTDDYSAKLIESEETESKGGGMGISESGFFGFETQYFPGAEKQDTFEAPVDESPL